MEAKRQRSVRDVGTWKIVLNIRNTNDADKNGYSLDTGNADDVEFTDDHQKHREDVEGCPCIWK